MRRPTLGWILAALIVLSTGCEGNSDAGETDEEVKKAQNSGTAKGEGTRTRDEIAAAVAELGRASPFDRSKLESVAREWQGHWVVPRYGERGTPHAWSISGREVSIFWSEGGDSRTETGRLRIYSPCGAKVEKIASAADRDGGPKGTQKSKRHLLFAFGGAERYATTGLSSKDLDVAGIVTDQETTEEAFTLCIGASDVVKWGDFGCKLWTYDSRYNPPETIECSLSDQSAEVALPDGEYLTVERQGDLLLGEDIAEKKLRSFPTFDAAKTAVE